MSYENYNYAELLHGIIILETIANYSIILKLANYFT